MSHYSPWLHYTTDKDSGYERLRVDVGQTGFFEGREFRAYFEFASEKSTSLAVGGTRYFRFTAPVQFILQTQRLVCDTGGIRLRAFTDATDGGGWSTAIPAIGKNRMDERRQPFYAAQCTLETGGSFTGGTEVDVLRARVASQSVSSQNVGASQDDERGLPISQFFLIAQPLAGVNDASQGIYSIEWEERPKRFWPLPVLG